MVYTKKLTSVEKMFKLAEWNKGRRRKRSYSTEHGKHISTFDQNECNSLDKHLIPSYD